MKDCNWNYPAWGIQQEYLNSEATVVPNPICAWCEYMQACAFRVNYYLEYNKDLPDEDLEIIKKCTQWNQVVLDAYSESSRTTH